MLAGENTQWSLRDFQQILASGSAPGQHWIVVGGQAVNFWASHYLADEPELTSFEPFTSKDLDLVGDRNDVEALAKVLAIKPSIPRRTAASPIIAIFNIETAAGPLTVEVLKGLAHLTRTEVEAQTTTLQRADKGPEIRVLNPIACLIDKISSVSRFDQRARQDLRHVQILILCTRAFLRELFTRRPNQTAPVFEAFGGGVSVKSITCRPEHFG
jgi:hypothetical protein